MLLLEEDFIKEEGGAPLLMQNHYYLHKHPETAWQKTRIWAKLLLNKELSTNISFDDEKKSHTNTLMEEQKNNNKKSENYGLKTIRKPDRIIRKDADRTFLTEPKRQLLITILESLSTLFNDYQQTMSYVSGILLLFFPPKTVFEMMFMLGRSPTYNMSGYWRSEAVAQGVDAYVLFEIIKKINPKLYNHLTKTQVLPDTFIQKWFGGLAVQVMPIEHLIEFWTQFFRHGFRYLFKFMISLLQILSPVLLSTNVDYKLYQILRLERSSRFWNCVLNENKNKNKIINMNENEKVSIFFTKVLSDTNSIGNLYNIDDIDFQKEREYAFNRYLCSRFLNAAQMVTFKGYEIESDNDDSDEFKDCEMCDDGYADVYCQQCKIYLCDECNQNPTGDHAVTHAIKFITGNASAYDTCEMCGNQKENQWLCSSCKVYNDITWDQCTNCSAKWSCSICNSDNKLSAQQCEIWNDIEKESHLYEKEINEEKEYAQEWQEIETFMKETENVQENDSKLFLFEPEMINIKPDTGTYENKKHVILYTENAKNAENKNDIIKLPCLLWKPRIKGDCPGTINIKFDDIDKFCIVYALFSDKEKVQNVFDVIVKYLQHKYNPIKWDISRLHSAPIDSMVNQSITTFSYTKPWSKYGVDIDVALKLYQHNIINTRITCEHMNAIKSNDPLQCPIYHNMHQKYQFTKENLTHLIEFTHFMDETAEKSVCRHNDECKAYIRMEESGNQLDDQCHMQLYRHPPRKRNIELSKNINPLIINTDRKQNHDVNWPTYFNRDNETDGYLSKLIAEVINNGYKTDLCLECEVNDDCKHDEYSILQIVDDKMNHVRHKRMGSPLTTDMMLALVLYTGGECNYDLCKEQRNNNFEKWKWFDYCLYNAIWGLNVRETGSFSVFIGLNGVKLDKVLIENGFFRTYVSTSWRKDVAISFMQGNEGMVIQIDKEYKNNKYIYCCDVSWISKFPDECEILFARSVTWDDSIKFACEVLNELNGIQTVSLKHTEKYISGLI